MTHEDVGLPVGDRTKGGRRLLEKSLERPLISAGIMQPEADGVRVEGRAQKGGQPTELLA